ncbi:MAG: hypothetical protein QOJ89_4627 [bacterium]
MVDRRRASRSIARERFLDGAVAGTALTLAGAAVDATAALRAGAGGGIDPHVATALWELGAALHGLAAPMAYAVPVLATAVLSARTALLPAWHAALGGALAIGLLSTPISHLAIVGFGFWVLLTEPDADALRTSTPADLDAFDALGHVSIRLKMILFGPVGASKRAACGSQLCFPTERSV